jgi:hypothetical protein
MNKIVTALILVMSFSFVSHAQIGIGTNTPEASAALDISSSDKGFLMPRMTTAQRDAIVTPVNGLSIFDSDTKSFWTYIEGSWVEAKPGVGKFIDGNADIAYYPDRVGIGRNAFSTAHKLYVESIKDTDGSHAATVIRGVYEGTGTATTTYGLGAVARNNGTGTIDYAIGTQGIIENPNAGGSINIGVGSWPQINNQGVMNYGSGLVIENANNAGTMTTARGQDVGLVNKPGATMGTAALSSMYATNDGIVSGDSYGLYIGGAGSGTVGGNSYALYLSTPFLNVTGDAFALYSENLNNSYLEGNLGVGTSDPQQKVHISGVLRLEPQASPPAGGAGDLYAGTDNKLYFHDGTDWKEIQLVP